MRAAVWAFVVVMCLWSVPAVHGQMPDPAAMSGMAMPSGDLPNASVSVRVVRGSMANNLAGVPVELHGAGAGRVARTGQDGRALFTGLPVGARVHALVTYEGAKLESSEFEVPAAGGMRTLLVFPEAGQPAAASGSAPAQAAPPPGGGAKGDLVLGGNTRVAIEFQQDVLQVFYLLEIVNRTAAPITPSSTLVFDMPTGAAGTTLLEGSTKQATAKGPRVTVPGPFPPGVTPLQVAFSLDVYRADVTIEQRFPLPMDMVAIAVERIGDLKVASPQVARTQETPIERSTFVMGTGPALEAGSPLAITLEGVPHHSRTPVYATLAIVVALVGWAAWVSFAPGAADATAARRRALETQRGQSLSQLAALEQQHRRGAVDETRYASKRAALVAQLERIYGELDSDAGAPSGGQGAAA